MSEETDLDLERTTEAEREDPEQLISSSKLDLSLKEALIKQSVKDYRCMDCGKTFTEEEVKRLEFYDVRRCDRPVQPDEVGLMNSPEGVLCGVLCGGAVYRNLPSTSPYDFQDTLVNSVRKRQEGEETERQEERVYDVPLIARIVPTLCAVMPLLKRHCPNAYALLENQGPVEARRLLNGLLPGRQNRRAPLGEVQEEAIKAVLDILDRALGASSS